MSIKLYIDVIDRLKNVYNFSDAIDFIKEVLEIHGYNIEIANDLPQIEGYKTEFKITIYEKSRENGKRMFYKKRKYYRKRKKYFCYDIFYKLYYDIESCRQPQLLHPRLIQIIMLKHYANTMIERTTSYPRVVENGWIHLASGNTRHNWRLMRLKNSKDLEGLKKYFEQRFEQVKRFGQVEIEIAT